MPTRFYRHLPGLFCAYFHQDWMLDDPDWQSVVQRYCRDHAAPEICATAEEIQSLLAESDPEPELSGRA